MLTSVSIPRQTRRTPVRVCFLIDSLSRAGTETQLLALIRDIDRTRIQPALVLLDGTDADSRELAPTDCPVLRLGVRSLVGLRALTAAVRLTTFWRRERTEIVQTYFLDSSYFGIPLARLAGIRHTIRVRNNLGYWLTPKHRWLGGFVNRLTETLLTNSDAGRAALQRAECIHPKRITVLENGVDIERFLSLPLPTLRGHALRIGCVANLRPVKNLDLLIDAAAKLVHRFPGLLFQVAGEGPERSALEARIAQQSLPGRFQLLGPVNDIPAFLKRQDIAVLCSRSEGMSNALLEYMAAGRVIVATNVGANNRLITDGVEGRLIPPGQVEALATALATVIENPATSRSYAAAAREKAVREFSRAAMCARFADFYEGIVARRKPAHES